MPYDGKLLARARNQLDTIRMDNQSEHQRRLDLIYRRIPEIQEIDQRLRAQMAELVRLTISRKADLQQELKQLQQDNLDLQMRRAELLVENGFAMDYLDDIYSCPKCRDTGVDHGGICECLVRLYNKELTQELSGLLKSGSESFEHFDLTLYSDTPDPAAGVVPRETMSMVFSYCQRYADSFPQVTSNLLFQGKPGLGKTYLSACIARVVAEKGCSVCYETASVALDAFERQKFARDPAEAEAAAQRVRRMLDCDLMILDDLGTEMVTSVSQSALYSLINGRLVAGKKTIISTNFNEEELERKYTPQIYSRLAGEFLHLPFVGQDIRRLRSIL